MGSLNIGIAGYMGSGKSTCANYLAQYGGTVIEADVVAKELLTTDATIQEQLLTHFGHTILRNKTIDFTELGATAFSSLDTLMQLNAIVHPPLLPRLQKLISHADTPLCICDAALIAYWQIEEWFDVLLWIYASEQIRFKRMHKKDGITSDALRTRMAVQEKLLHEPSGNRWIYLANEGTVQEFTEEIEQKSSIDFSSLSLINKGLRAS